MPGIHVLLILPILLLLLSIVLLLFVINNTIIGGGESSLMGKKGQNYGHLKFEDTVCCYSSSTLAE